MKTLNFKNISLFLCLTLFCGLGYAQDIIVTKDSKRIEAKILEVNINDIKYKNFNNQNGPTYTILKSEIASIIYENGTVEAFSNAQISNASSNSSRNVGNANNGTLMSVSRFNQMNDKEQELFLEQVDPEIYSKFRGGASLRTTGKVLFSIGMGLSGGGLGLIIGGAAVGDADIISAGGTFLSIGQTLVLVSIPLSAIGGAKKKSAQNDYKAKYSGISSHGTSLKLNFYGNGVGLAIAF
jgi:hypothetical protein